MPDFFLDHFVYFGQDLDEFFRRMREVAERGGGNIAPVEQEVWHGGNASNTAAALAELGVSCHLILRTNLTGYVLLSRFLGGKVDLSHVKKDGKLSATVAVELFYRGRAVNIMISDSGSVAEFGFDSLDESDLELLKKADVVCVLNWNQNKKGTELTEKVFEFVKEKGKGRTFFDPGDPSVKEWDIPNLREVLRRGLIDVISLNENELRYLSPRKGSEEDMARALHEVSGATVDLHTPKYCISVTEEGVFRVPCFDVKVKRVTGAGDAWNAGDIFGYLAGMESRERLITASAVAGFYISEGRAPSREEVASFVKHTRFLAFETSI